MFWKVQLDRAEWGSDLPSVEVHMESHKTVQKAIDEFQMSLKEAKLNEVCAVTTTTRQTWFCDTFYDGFAFLSEDIHSTFFFSFLSDSDEPASKTSIF